MKPRHVLALSFLVILVGSVRAEDPQPPAQSSKPKESIASRLDREKTGSLDEVSKSPADQIEAAHDRFVELYLEAKGKDEERAVRDVFDAVYDRILKRAAEKVREAKENLEFSKRPRESKGERA